MKQINGDQRIAQALQKAIELHQSGNFSQAEEMASLVQFMNCFLVIANAVK